MATNQSTKNPSRPKKKSTPQNSEQPDKEAATQGLTFARNVIHPPLWVDQTRLVLRDDFPIASLIFYSVIPDQGIIEETARIQTSVEHLRKIVDLLCRQLDYYPDRVDADDNAK
jgi:hypothetical protein